MWCGDGEGGYLGGGGRPGGGVRVEWKMWWNDCISFGLTWSIISNAMLNHTHNFSSPSVVAAACIKFAFRGVTLCFQLVM